MFKIFFVHVNKNVLAPLEGLYFSISYRSQTQDKIAPKEEKEEKALVLPALHFKPRFQRGSGGLPLDSPLAILIPPSPSQRLCREHRRPEHAPGCPSSSPRNPLDSLSSTEDGQFAPGQLDQGADSWIWAQEQAEERGGEGQENGD